jgi:hypothetical protein
VPKKPTHKRTARTLVKSSRRSRPKPQPPAGPPHHTGIPPAETLKQQADLLGLLDPLDAEPTNIYSPTEFDT